MGLGKDYEMTVMNLKKITYLKIKFLPQSFYFKITTISMYLNKTYMDQFFKSKLYMRNLPKGIFAFRKESYIQTIVVGGPIISSGIYIWHTYQTCC